MPAPNRAADFGEILESALTLAPHEQARLCLVLQRVAGAAPEPAALVAPASGALAAPDATPPGPSCEEWLRTIRDEPGWTQLQLLDEALSQADTQDDVRSLSIARERLLQDQPAIAVRGAVVDLATRHPVGVLLGCAGLVLALLGLGRAIFAAIF